MKCSYLPFAATVLLSALCAGNALAATTSLTLSGTAFYYTPNTGDLNSGPASIDITFNPSNATIEYTGGYITNYLLGSNSTTTVMGPGNFSLTYVNSAASAEIRVDDIPAQYGQPATSIVGFSAGSTGTYPTIGCGCSSPPQEYAAAFALGAITNSTFPSLVSPLTANISAPTTYNYSTPFIPNTVLFNYLPGYGVSLGAGSPYTLEITNVSLTSATPPTQLDLAEMSSAVYNVSSAPTIDGYVSTQNIVGTAGFAAEVFKSGNQVVLAIRGTDMSNEYNNLKTLAADSSFSTGKVTPQLTSEVSQAANLLEQLHTQCPSCNFYVTGHSLGGAIAQVLGLETGLPTQAFNAPGAGAVLSQLQAQVPSLTGASGLTSLSWANSGINDNLRVYGDLISQVGAPVGTQTELDITQDYALTTVLPELTFNENHAIGTIVNTLTGNSYTETTCTGSCGPAISLATLGLVYEYFNGYEGQFNNLVQQGAITAFDPPSGAFYTIVNAAGSPDYGSIALPLIPGVSEYDVEYLVGSQWSTDHPLAPGVFLDLPADVNGIAFEGLGQGGNKVELPMGFSFVSTFDTTGELSATFTVAQIPEPKIWAELVLGVFFLGAFCRSRRRQWRRSNRLHVDQPG